MSRLLPAAMFSVAAVLVLAGCAYFTETRTIEQFTSALEARDLDGLRSGASGTFQHKAFRRDDAAHDLKLLRLPHGEAEVVEVEDVSDGEKLVTAAIGEKQRKVFYRLVQNEKRWVVDDVFVRQQLDGLQADKSVAEQMDLLLSVRDFLDAWNGDRPAALAAVTPEFGEILRALPPVHFSRLARRVVGQPGDTVQFESPGVTNLNTGIVRLPRRSGTLVLTLQNDDGAWKVADAAVESPHDGEHLPSVLKTAAAIHTAVEFLHDYSAGDKAALSKRATEGFYRSSLLPAELASVPLPTGDYPQEGYEIDMQPGGAEFVLPTDGQIVRISLVTAGEADVTSRAPEFRVDDVTLFEPAADGSEPREMRLSMLFTGRAMLQLFSEALAAGDMPMLRKTSTTDFNRRAWDDLDQPALHELARPLIALGPPHITGTVFQGAVTEIATLQDGQRVTYVLRDREGNVRVDDVLLETAGRPKSLKTMLELLIPVRRFTAALTAQQFDVLQRNSSHDLNRLVWTETDRMPPVGFAAVQYLAAPLTGVTQPADEQWLLTLGNERFGAQVRLVHEHGRHVVDDVQLIAGVLPAERVALKDRLRDELVRSYSTARADSPRRVLVENAAGARQTAAFPPAREPDRRPPLEFVGYDRSSPTGPAARNHAMRPADLQPLQGAFDGPETAPPEAASTTYRSLR